jgi:hypothetical protein
MECKNCRYRGIANLNGEDKEVCLATGEIVLIKDVEKCPLEGREELEGKIEIEPSERVEEIFKKIEKSYEILEKLNEKIEKLRILDEEDIIALIKGKTGLSAKRIRAVLEAMDKATKLGKKPALKKFIASIGNISMKDVSIVIDEIERFYSKIKQEG